MAHYAVLDDKNIVTTVFVGRDEDDLPDGVTDWELYYGERHGATVKRTSYNTRRGEHLLGGTPFRKNYAGKGMRYDETLDAFIPIQPYPSWVLNEETCSWEPPYPEPQIINEKTGEPVCHDWDEEAQDWVVAE
jgi:hypothetical protein